MKRFLDCHKLHTLSLPVTQRVVLWEMEFGDRAVKIPQSAPENVSENQQNKFQPLTAQPPTPLPKSRSVFMLFFQRYACVS